MKVIFSGLEGSGKSLKLAMVASEIAHRNSKWYRKQQEQYKKAIDTYEHHLSLLSATDPAKADLWHKNNQFPQSPIPRPIYSNLLFSEVFREYVERELGIPVHYWNNLDDLIKIENADVLMDEVGNYFDSRMWADLSLDVRRWLTQGSKMGIELYGTAQDFAQVDKSFRRLCNDLIHIVKVVGSRRPSATKPPVKQIWGICMTRNLDPQGYDEDKKKFAGSFSMPGFFLIEKEYCDIFDTTQKILRSKPPALKHIERTCENEKCGYHKTTHI